MIIVEDSTTVVISLLRSDYGNLTLLIMNLQILYSLTPKSYDVYLFVIKLAIINVSNIIIRNSVSSNIMSLQNVNGTISNSIFYNISTQTAGALFYFAAATLLYPCNILFSMITMEYASWTPLGSITVEKGYFIYSAINNMHIILSNSSFMSINFTINKCFLMLVVNNVNILQLYNCTFVNNSMISKL